MQALILTEKEEKIPFNDNSATFALLWFKRYVSSPPSRGSLAPNADDAS